MWGQRTTPEQLPPPPQSIAEVLHFVQREWAAFSRERAEWQEERKAMKLRINSLEGELEASRRLRRDLIRRIKMLELVIQQERAKAKGEQSSSQVVTKDPADEELPEREPLQAKLAKVKEGREILIGYLREVGVTKNLLELQAQKLEEQVPDFTELLQKRDRSRPQAGASSSSFEFARSMSEEAVGSSDEDEEDEGDAAGARSGSYSLHTTQRLPASQSADPTVPSVSEAFSFLDDEQDGEQQEQHEEEEVIGQTAGRLVVQSGTENVYVPAVEEDDDDDATGGSEERQRGDSGGSAAAASVARGDGTAQQEQEEQAEKKEKKGGEDGGEGDDEDDPFKDLDAGQLQSMMGKKFGKRAKKMLKGSSRGRVRNLFGMDKDEDLGELANVTVDDEPAQDDDEKLPVATETKTGTMKARKEWRTKFVLKSHLRSINCVEVHSEDPMVVTGGDDNTIKVWWLPKPHPKKTLFDVMPVTTLRGHTGPVRALTLMEQENHCFSGSDDGTIRCWMLPEEDFDATEAYESAEMYQLRGHSGAVTSITHRRGPHIVSASKDGTCKVWNAETRECEHTWTCPDGDTPVRVHVLNHDPTKAAVITEKALIYLLNIDTMDTIRTLDPSSFVKEDDDDDLFTSSDEEDADNNKDKPLAATCLTSHFSSPLLAVGFSDHHVRVFDTESGEVVSDFCAHTCPVTSVNFTVGQPLLLTTGTDRNIRLWDSETFKCQADYSAHRQGPRGAVLDSCFNRAGTQFVTAGAEGTARVYM